MYDQAELLRQKIQYKKEEPSAKVIAVVSGKGGVGKSNFSLNFSIGLSKQNKKVLIIDIDVEMGNINILIGQTGRYTIANHFNEGIPLRMAISAGPEGIHYIPGGTGLTNFFKMDQKQFAHFSHQFQSILEEYDFIILDMGAGISEQSLQFIVSANELIYITTPEPTAITDAYSIMKYLVSRTDAPFYLLCNRASSRKEGNEVILRLTRAAQQFLHKEILALGILPDDKTVQKAVIRQIPFILLNSRAPSSEALNKIIAQYMGSVDKEGNSPASFMKKMKNFLFERQA
ncbi:MinD/ParA family protein [Bacillus sp. E214]|uniref:MinD/ParA family protein n=1 Tax=Bacillus sp. E214 TaxID=2587156 RepID=UPI001652A304|nr:MinD/ParA family protein [Bacillus sp. E214]